VFKAGQTELHNSVERFSNLFWEMSWLGNVMAHAVVRVGWKHPSDRAFRVLSAI